MAWVDTYVFGPEFDDLRAAAHAERTRVWENELQREVPRDHPLFGRDWAIIAKWDPQDEVVVRSGDDVAVVHLTFTRRPPEHLPYPRTEFFQSAAEFEAFFESR